MIHAREHTVCSNRKIIWIKRNPGPTGETFDPVSYLPSCILPAGLDAYPAVAVDTHGGAQHHGLRAQVVSHLDVTVHDGEGDVVGAFHALPAPQHQALGRFCADAQFKLIHQESFFTGKTEDACFQLSGDFL